MGVVYKARHALMERTVAIKMLQANLVSDASSVKRFHHESKAASRINHPHVITIYDFGISTAGLPYIVMDYLEGQPLYSLIKDDGCVGVERTIKIVSQACDALAHAHKQGVIHRDLKPSNIVLINYDDDKDFVKVVDFGVAKLINAGDGQRLTQTGEVCGSPVYMSPEQCLGRELDIRSDIYSMGIVIYESLTGTLPIIGKTMMETMSKHLSDRPPSFATVRPDLYIPERLEQVVLKALAKDPDARQQSMDDLRQELEFAIPRPGRSQALRVGDRSLTTSKTSLSPRKDPKVKWLVALAIALVSLIGLGISKFVPQKSKQPSAANVSKSANIQSSAVPAPRSPAASSPAASSIDHLRAAKEATASVPSSTAQTHRATRAVQMPKRSLYTSPSYTSTAGVTNAANEMTKSSNVQAFQRMPKRIHRIPYSTAQSTISEERNAKAAKAGKNPWDSLREELNKAK